MIGEFLLKLNKVLSHHKIYFFSGLILLLGFFFLGISRLKVSESIFATFPKGKSFSAFNQLIESSNIINQIVFSVVVSPEISSQEARELAVQFTDSLRRNAGESIRNIQAERPAIQEDVYSFTLSKFPELIDSSYYQHIAERIVPDSIRKSVNSVHNQLLAPGGTFLKEFLIHDPLGITGNYFRELSARNNTSGMVIDDGIMFTANRDQIIIMAATNYDSGQSDLNVQVFEKMEAFRKKWNVQNTNNPFRYFGTFEISARNAIQVKQDTLNTTFIALAAILLILVLYYRKLLIPVYILLPGLFGGLFALGIIGYFRPEVSGLSLATGAVIFGILLDYAFHFFTHLRHTQSLSIAIQEVSAPLLTGSFTTILAFSALYFTNSVVLQDFGLFASLSLSGAALFTLIGLPVILHSFSFNDQKVNEGFKGFHFPVIPERFRSWTLLLILLLTLVFLYFSGFTQFDSSIESLSIQNDELRKREESLTGLNSDREKRIYIFAKDKERNVAEISNQKAYEQLLAMQKNGSIKSFVTSAPFLVPEEVKKERLLHWHRFWNLERKERTFNALDEAALSYGFTPSAFNNFKDLVSNQARTQTDRDTLLRELGLDNLIHTDATGTTLISTLTVNETQLGNVKRDLRQIAGIEIFDRGEMAGDLLTLVKNDFNYILFISAAVVFFTLLIVYGRIELTLLSFLPMVISWIWILGIAVLLGIKFNFVNVIVTTFIFGLGDDFSIFVTDGLLNQYKYKKDTLRSYQSAIALSAMTTLIGTGVLLFAKHPAIHSIGLISVLGIVCILFISIIFQPILFDFFVQNRIKRDKAPVTMQSFLISLSSFSYFVLGCLFLHSKLVLILLLPVSRRLKRKMLNKSLSFFARTVIYSGPHVRKNFSGLTNLDLNKPAIFIANHSSFLDILLAILLNPKIVLMVKGWVYKFPLFGPVIRYAGYIYTDDGTEKNTSKMRRLIEDGYSLFVFPEGTRSEDGKIGRFHKGAFQLAQELGLDIQLVLIHGASDVLPKNDFFIKAGALNVRVLPRIHLDDPEWGVQLRDKTKHVSHFFKEQFASFQHEMEDVRYIKNKIFSNYVYKGPVLEWYFKSKWKLEGKHYAYYHKLIEHRKNILDIGCGYGFLSFFLHYKNENRVITGIDYDEEKISIAQNSYNKTENLQFICGDIMQTPIGVQDVIFLNDVLHYLSQEKQQNLLDQCAEHLSKNGMLFIRDGITDNLEKHRNTVRTEAFSTGLFSFNKKQEEFYFFSSEEIRIFAEKHYLSMEMIEHSSTTSNVLFILRKNG